MPGLKYRRWKLGLWLALWLGCWHPAALVADHVGKVPLDFASSLTVVAVANSPPLLEVNNVGEFHGFGLDLVEAIGVFLGVRINVVQVDTLATARHWVQVGQADLLLGLAPLSHGPGPLGHTLPILEMTERIFVTSDRYDVVDLNSLRGHAVACVDEYPFQEHLHALHPSIRCHPVGRPQDGLFALLDRQVDAFVFPEPITLHFIHELRLRDQIKAVGDPVHTLSWHLAVKRGRDGLRAALDDAIVHLRANGAWGRIHQKWFGSKLFAGYTRAEVQRWLVMSMLMAAMGVGLLFFWLLSRQQRLANRRLAEAALARERARTETLQAHHLLRSILDALPVWVFWKDLDLVYRGCNQSMLRGLGLEGEEQLVGRQDHEMPWAGYAGRFSEDDRRVLASGAPRLYYEEPYQLANGRQGWALTSKLPLTGADGRVIGLIGVVEEITERKETMTALKHANRAVTTLGHCATAVALAKGERGLLDDVCRLVVEVGGYRMAWVGMARQDLNRSVQPVAWHGRHTDYLENLGITWGEYDPRSQGPVGQAIRTRMPAVVRNLAHEGHFALWREQAMARGFAAICALPLISEGSLLGALAIYAGEENAFDDREMLLLQDLANTLAIGIHTRRTEQRRMAAEAALARRARLDREMVHLSRRLLLTGPIEWEGVLASLMQTLGAQGGELWRLGEDGAELVLVGCQGRRLGPDASPQPRAAVLPLLIRLEQEDPLLLPAGTPLVGDDPPPPGQAGEQPRSLLLVGVRDASGGLEGVLVFGKEVGHPWREEEWQALSVAAHMVGAWWQRQAAQERLQQSESQYRRLSREFLAILHAMRDPILLLSEELRLEWANDSARHLLRGYLEREAEPSHPACAQMLLGRPCDDCSEACFVRSTLTRALPHGQRLAAVDGRVWEARAFPVQAESAAVETVLLVLTEVSNLLAVQEQAMRGAHLASLGVLTASMAHEINNPNQMILSNGYLLEELTGELQALVERYVPESERRQLGGLPWAEVATYLPQLTGAIVGGSQRIKRIVAQLKGLARQEYTPLDERVELAQVISDALALLSSRVSRMTDHLELRLAPGLPPVSGSCAQLEQVVINLLLNALESLPDRQRRVTVDTSLAPGGQAVRVRISDEGRGIPEQHLAKVTEPLFTTKGSQGGTGLGLSVCREIIQRHRGRMEITSQEGQGTTVTLTLPIEQPASSNGDWERTHAHLDPGHA